ncbi:MAG: hypothetical protein Q4G24_10370 [Paracoccus sp. (in: a-proteobacteria)]|uniref:hypothetical protein n=1 Tax=Paracoccus sp. TaxID=267 RepID=UPI0026E06AAB|nr:hypothetical protein [Paracoccus sp. (in: a-proteobacteria)]MDO5621862.1 hypothetical protein [Paracoccus sp. (in: a-proteobacteria)]
MKAVFHLGAHDTDGEALIESLTVNGKILREHRVEAVENRRHQGIFSEALNALQGGTSTHEMEQMMLDAVLESDRTPDRVIFSSPGFLGLPHRMLSANGLYYSAPERILRLINLLPSAEVEFAIGLKNPALLIAHVQERQPNTPYEQLMFNIDPLALRWNEAFRRMLQAAGSRPITVWAHEDTPLIWPELLRRIAGLDASEVMIDQMKMAQLLLPHAAVQQVRAKMREYGPAITVSQRRELIEAALVSHADPAALTAPVDLPGWSQDLVDEITALYHADLAEIAALPGVEFISA